MQLCEFCQDLNTCKLPKRVNDDLFASCSSFKKAKSIPQKRYDAIKSQFVSLRKRSQAAQTIEETFLVDIPMGIRTQDLLWGKPHLSLDFLETDFTKRDQVISFFRESKLDGHLWMAGFLPKPPLPEQGPFPIKPNFLADLKAVQIDLQEIINNWVSDPSQFGNQAVPLHLENRRDIVAKVYLNSLNQLSRAQADDQTDIFKINAWLHHTFSFGIKRMADGPIKPFGRMNRTYWYGILYLSLVQDIIEEQVFKQCPVCQNYYLKRKTGPKGATCGKQKCRTYFSRNREKLLKEM